MRGTTSMVIVLLVTALVIGLYVFLMLPRFNKQIAELQVEKAKYEKERLELAVMQTQIPEMKRKLPEWRTRLGLYRQAIPEGIEDDVFLRNLEEQITKNGVELINVSLTRGNKWLRELDEKSKEQLTGIGVDVEAAQQIEVAFYAITLSGDYKNVLSTLEELKRYGRLYSIEQVNAPAGGVAGTVVQNDTPTAVPLEVTGAIFFGIPRDFMNVEDLYMKYVQSLLAPLANGTHIGVREAASEVLKGKGAPQQGQPRGQQDQLSNAGGMNS